MQLLYDRSVGRQIPLPRSFRTTYGPLRLPLGPGPPYVIANFASTLDGVVSLGTPGRSSGGEITGFDPHDRIVMGILRSVADAVVVGAGTLRAVPRHTWTAEHIVPRHADEVRTFRRRWGRPPVPLNVVVTASGRLDLRLPLFVRGEVPVLVVTTTSGARRLSGAARLPSTKVRAVAHRGPIRASAILRAIRAVGSPRIVLVEGGPHLLGTFLSERQLDALFLTIAAQVAGRNGAARPGFVAGRELAPDHPLWGELVGVRRGRDLLFLRYRFGRGPSAGRRPSPTPPGRARRREP
jgi:riboflavin biosynthesis pyrimidine reductase